MTYQIGDVVFYSLSGHTVAGEATFIGHPKGDKSSKVLVLALAAEVGFEVDADECSATGRQQPAAGPRVSPAILPQSSGRPGRQSILKSVWCVGISVHMLPNPSRSRGALNLVMEAAEKPGVFLNRTDPLI